MDARSIAEDRTETAEAMKSQMDDLRSENGALREELSRCRDLQASPQGRLADLARDYARIAGRIHGDEGD